MLLCVFCRVLAAPSSLSQPKPFHGPKNMSLAASTISSAISSQSRYICKALFFQPNLFWFCIMLSDMRFSVSEGIELGEEKHNVLKEQPLPYLLHDSPARKQQRFRCRIRDHKVLLEQRCFTWMVCADFTILKWKYLPRNTGWEWWTFFFLVETQDHRNLLSLERENAAVLPHFQAFSLLS